MAERAEEYEGEESGVLVTGAGSKLKLKSGQAGIASSLRPISLPLSHLKNAPSFAPPVGAPTAFLCLPVRPPPPSFPRRGASLLDLAHASRFSCLRPRQGALSRRPVRNRKQRLLCGRNAPALVRGERLTLRGIACVRWQARSPLHDLKTALRRTRADLALFTGPFICPPFVGHLFRRNGEGTSLGRRFPSTTRSRRPRLFRRCASHPRGRSSPQPS
jgi:hypothetical protein